MIPQRSELPRLEVKVYFLFWKVYKVFQSAILTMFIITKTQVKMPQKRKMVYRIKNNS